MLEKCIKIYPLENKVIVALADIYVINKESEKAISLLSDSLQCKPQDAQLWYHLACIYKNTHKLNSALFAVSQSIKESTNSKKALLLLFDIYILATVMTKAGYRIMISHCYANLH